jgi:hypothetical protein
MIFCATARLQDIKSASISQPHSSGYGPGVEVPVSQIVRQCGQPVRPPVPLQVLGSGCHPAILGHEGEALSLTSGRA